MSAARVFFAASVFAIGAFGCALGASNVDESSGDDYESPGGASLPDPPEDETGSADAAPAPPDPTPEPPPEEGGGEPPPDPTCSPGFFDCGSGCVNILRDRDNCGACGRACSKNATGCSAGRCTCISGQHACGTQCVNLHWNEANCGSCGHACGAGKKCCDGVCRSRC